ncbi:MAG: LysR family transcriptional regulator [Acidobacteria bacterium]|nr:MAG: LysR family transcriptional regulator [Acidobacteriota bacterium]
MNLDTLSLYCDVIRSGSFSLGAAAHRISQSAASQAVRQLEEEVGAQLIDRTKRPFMVMPEGRKFFDACLVLLENFEKAKAEITSQRTLVGGAVRVAVIYSVGLHDMGFYTQQFTTRYPQAKIRLAYLHPNEVIDAVVNDEADLGILSFPAPHRSLTIVPWHSEPMVFVCHRTHPLARRKTVSFLDLEGETFVAFDRGLVIRKAIDKALRQRGVSINATMEFDNIETIKQAITIQSGVSILPQPSVLREIEAGILAAIPLDMPELVRPIGIIHRRQKLLTPTADKLLDFLQSQKH